MNDQGKKSPIRHLAAGLLGFVGIVGLGSLVMMHHGAPAAAARVAFVKPASSDPASPLRTVRPSAPVAGSGKA